MNKNEYKMNASKINTKIMKCLEDKKVQVGTHTWYPFWDYSFTGICLLFRGDHISDDNTTIEKLYKIFDLNPMKISCVRLYLNYTSTLWQYEVQGERIWLVSVRADVIMKKFLTSIERKHHVIGDVILKATPRT